MHINSLGHNQIVSTYFANQNSVNQNMHTVSSAFKNRDVLTISKQGKKESLVQQLLNQKKLIQENKEALLKKGIEDGYIDQEKLDDFDEQLKALNEQIAKAYSDESQHNTEDKSTNKNKPMTEEEYRQQKLNDISSISGSLKNTEIALSAKAKMEGEKNVLEAEIKADGGNASESKFKRIAEIDAKTSSIMNQTGKELSDINDSVTQKDENVIIQNSENEKTHETSENNDDNKENTSDEHNNVSNTQVQ